VVPVIGAIDFDRRTKTYSTQKVIASFIGFVPKENPAVVIGIFLDEPHSNKWGSSAAAPVFQEIAHQYLRYKHITPHEVKTMVVKELGPYLKQRGSTHVALTTEHKATASLAAGTTIF
jgi:hypothetical protein